MSEIVPSRPIFSSKSKADSSEKKKSKKRKKNDRKVKVGGKKNKNGNTKVEKVPKEDREADEDSDVDLDKELMPIGAYINNRELMVEHVFKSVKGHKLQTLLPDILKNAAVNELREMCCHQLEGMSKKRIRYILAGEEMSSSSGTEESFSDDGKAVEEDKQMEPRTRDTSPDTSNVVHSTCDNQGEGKYMSVGSTQDDVIDPIVSTADDLHEAQAEPGDAIELDDCPPIKSESEVEKMEEVEMEEGVNEENESVTSEEMEEGSEEGEVRCSMHDEEGVASCSKQEIQGIGSGKSIMEKNRQVSGNLNKDWDEEGDEEGHEEGGAGTKPSKSVIGVTSSSNQKGDGLNINVPKQSAESTKPSSELEILELELRARAIRSLMQKVAQNKEQK